jgi:hypothetical protein
LPRSKRTLDYANNLILLCPYHHRMLHEQRWKIEGNPNGPVIWIKPDRSHTCREVGHDSRARWGLDRGFAIE